MATRPLAFLNARLINPEKSLDQPGALLVKGETIADLGPRLFNDGLPPDAQEIDCKGQVLMPGLIDMCVFTGEPGSEQRETLATASAAAAAGGITTIVVMPNTDPVIDDVSLVDFIKRRARATAKVRVHSMAALTKGLNGQQMTEMGLLAEAGARGFTDGNRAIADSKMMLRVLSYAVNFGLLVAPFPAEPSLTAGGLMNAGELATRLGLVGTPSAAEVIMVERDIRLAELAAAPIHISPISCRESVDAVARAKAKGLPVTCAVTAAHLSLNENDIETYLTFRKLMPPLRSETDRQALVEGLANGTIDVVVSSHDPQPAETKRLPFGQAAFGGTGLETLLAATLQLVHNGALPLPQMLRSLTTAPAKLLGLDGGRLAKGAPADLALVDINRPWVVDSDRMLSRSKNTPFDGRKLEGRVLRTVVAGETVYELQLERAPRV
jgi:dihydroorotase